MMIIIMEMAMTTDDWGREDQDFGYDYCNDHVIMMMKMTMFTTMLLMIKMMTIAIIDDMTVAMMELMMPMLSMTTMMLIIQIRTICMMMMAIKIVEYDHDNKVGVDVNYHDDDEDNHVDDKDAAAGHDEYSDSAQD